MNVGRATVRYTVYLDRVRRKAWTQQVQEAVLGYVCLLPTLLYAAVFLVFPIGFSVVLSFLKWPMFGPKKVVWLQNYGRIVQDKYFWLSLKNAAQFTLFNVPLSIIVALAVALLLNQKIRGIKFYRTGYFVPVVTSTVAVAVVWRFLLNKEYGLFNDWLRAVGLPKVGWLVDPDIAMYSIIIFSLWRALGGNVVLYLAALQGVPAHLYDAAKIDGAGAWARFRYVTWPMVTPTTFFMFIMGVIGSIQMFEQSFIMTGGGPMRATYVVFMYMYDYAFRYNEMGYAAAVGYLIAVVIFAMTLVNMKVTGKYVYYEQV